MVEMENVSAGYGKYKVLHNINLKLLKGQVTTLVGVNGSGKSTLLKTLLGFLPLSDGKIRIDGIPMENFSREELARKIAYLPQGNSVPDITAGRMVLHGRFPYLSYPRKYRAQDIAIAEQAMSQMGIVELAERPMAELSGGMRQKVYIAMALAQQAAVIVMDEPTTYLDIGQQIKFADLIRKLSEDGKTILLVLHDLPLAFKISGQIAVIWNGVVAEYGTAQKILKSGVIERLCGVTVKSTLTEAGEQYFYDFL